MLKRIHYLRIFLWLILASFILFIVWQAVVPSGRAVYEFDFKKSSFFIGRLTPRERVGVIARGQQTITGQPVYFNLWTPRPFNKLKLTIKYKSNQTPLIEVGLLMNKQSSAYYLQPLNNETLNELYISKNWGMIQSGQTILLQREETYANVQDFLNHLPPAKNIAIYNYSLPGGNYKKVNAEFIINPDIKYIIGKYQLPKTIGEWQMAEVEFDLTRVQRTKDGYGLMLSAPFLNADGVDVSFIKAELSGQKFSDFFKF
jgi:hypothetical protein